MGTQSDKNIHDLNGQWTMVCNYYSTLHPSFRLVFDETGWDGWMNAKGRPNSQMLTNSPIQDNSLSDPFDPILKLVCSSQRYKKTSHQVIFTSSPM